MKTTYPIVIYPKGKEKYSYVYVPDFDRGTQGEDLAECMDMARDLIGLLSLDISELPLASSYEKVLNDYKGCLVTLVDIDIDKYKKEYYNRTVRRNVTLPYSLDEEARKAGINVSAVLQVALKKELNMN